jgi:type IV secretion system protein VirB2
MFKVTKMRKKMFSILLVTLMASVAVLVLSGAALATPSDTKTGMAWEGALDILVQSLTGPVAMAISFIAVVAAGAALIFGGDMTGFMRTAIYIVLVIGLIVSAGSIFQTLFASSALLPLIL